MESRAVMSTDATQKDYNMTKARDTIISDCTPNISPKLGPPPADAPVGSKHLPWLRLSDWELHNLQRRMKKSAKWRPSEDMIKRELVDAGRGARAYRVAREMANVKGVKFVDEEHLDEPEAGTERLKIFEDWEKPNVGMILNQAKKRKREIEDAEDEQTKAKRVQGENEVTRWTRQNSDHSLGDLSTLRTEHKLNEARQKSARMRNDLEEAFGQKPGTQGRALVPPRNEGGHRSFVKTVAPLSERLNVRKVQGTPLDRPVAAPWHSIDHARSQIQKMFSCITDDERKDLALTHDVSEDSLEDWLLAHDLASAGSLHSDRKDEDKKTSDTLQWRGAKLVNAMSRESMLAAMELMKDRDAEHESFREATIDQGQSSQSRLPEQTGSTAAVSMGQEPRARELSEDRDPPGRDKLLGDDSYLIGVEEYLDSITDDWAPGKSSSPPTSHKTSGMAHFDSSADMSGTSSSATSISRSTRSLTNDKPSDLAGLTDMHRTADSQQRQIRQSTQDPSSTASEHPMSDPDERSSSLQRLDATPRLKNLPSIEPSIRDRITTRWSQAANTLHGLSQVAEKVSVSAAQAHNQEALVKQKANVTAGQNPNCQGPQGKRSSEPRHQRLANFIFHGKFR